jgi:sugar phosphate isomerase/epimerase
MGTSRRTFVKQGALAMASAPFLSKSLFAATRANADVVGIQLYSIRLDMNKDPLGTLKLLSAMGYKNVEHANYVNRTFYKYSPTDFKKVLDDNGLKMPSGHTVMGKQAWDASKNDFSDSWKYTVEDAATVGQLFVVSPSLDMTMTKTMDDFKKLMEIFNKSGELCKKHGMKFGYHNHAFEFNTMIDGKRIYDIILSSTDPALVAQQLDIGNLFNGGVVAMDIIKQYPGRFELMHVKDEIKNTASNGELYESTILGEGIVHTKEVIDQGRKEGTKYFIIEQESYGGKTPIDCVKEDLAVMKKWGY